MNNELKNKINELKDLGYGYKKIAKEFAVTASAVRYACSKMSDEDLLEGKCEHCGLKIKSIKGKKKKRFCSDKCRWQWWNKHKVEIEKKAYYTQKCKFCGNEFSSYGNNKRVYCSQDCYIKFKLNMGAITHGSL